MSIGNILKDELEKMYLLKSILIITILVISSGFTSSSVFAQSDSVPHDEDYCKSFQPYNYNVSIQVLTIGEIDTKASSYDMDFVLSITSDDVDFTKCPPPSEWIFTNGYVDKTWGESITPHYYKLNMHGIFHNEMDFRNYPFHELTLVIKMGPPYPYTIQNTKFINNENFSGIGFAGEYVAGYKIGEPRIQILEVTTPFATFPHFMMSIPLSSDEGMVFLKKILPVLILGGFGYSTYFLSSRILQDRLTILGTVFVGAIFFHAAILLAEIPPVSYLTIADKVMISIYSAFSFVLVTITLHQRYTNIIEKNEKNHSLLVAHNIDRKFMGFTLIFAVLIFLVLYLI